MEFLLVVLSLVIAVLAGFSISCIARGVTLGYALRILFEMIFGFDDD